MHPVLIILLALILDLLIGDPICRFHPIRLIGRLARFLEGFYRGKFINPFWAGSIMAVSVYLIVFFVPYWTINQLTILNPLIADCVSIFLIYTCFATRDLIKHSNNVYKDLKADSLKEARKKVGYMVGRDTHNLSPTEIIRATVESVSENMVDGITAPLFFAFIGGAPLAVLYKSISTLDSLFGYKNEKYVKFGKVSAIVDDVANYFPARLSSPLIIVSSFFLKMYPFNALKVFLRDRNSHPSPNAGFPESAFAGALGIQLGGESHYGGIKKIKPLLGNPIRNIEVRHIGDANKILLLTLALTFALYFFIYLLVQLSI